jgi:hypothetical protein
LVFRPEEKKIDCGCLRTSDEDNILGHLKRSDGDDILGCLRVGAKESVLDIG